jgi:tetratricopeptide (TPR) repeat protein
MSLGGALFLIAALATADALDAAQEAFDRGDYDRAEQLALAAEPRGGLALYLAGLARFRAGRPAAALEALDAASRAADPPARALWLYNRGACLYELERFEEAEAAYVEAAELDAAVAALALVDAGFAALDARSPERARALAARARAAADAPRNV